MDGLALVKDHTPYILLGFQHYRARKMHTSFNRVRTRKLHRLRAGSRGLESPAVRIGIFEGEGYISMRRVQFA